MPFRFSRRIKIAPGFHLNLSKSGIGFSQKVGPLTVGTKRTSLDLPGVGASIYTNNQTKKSQNDLLAMASDFSETASVPETVAPNSNNASCLMNTLIGIAMIIIVCLVLFIFSLIIPSDNNVVSNPTATTLSNFSQPAIRSNPVNSPIPNNLIVPPPVRGGSQNRSCCKVCGPSSQPCGDACISNKFTCSKAPGCACK